MGNFEMQSPEELLKQQVIDELKTKGQEGPEALEIYGRWFEEEQEKANALDTPEANIDFLLKTARLFKEAGLYAALDHYEDARIQAWHMQNDGLYQDIEDEMDIAEDVLLPLDEPDNE
jgi:hypothetical protein